jgi:hypothetical protein
MLDTMHKTYTRKDIACTAAALPVPVPAVQTGRHVMAAQSEAASTATSINVHSDSMNIPSDSG